MSSTSSTRRRRLAALALVAPLALPGLACGDDDDAATGGAESGDGAMTVDIAEPSDGAEVGEPFEVVVEPSVPIGEPDTGRHHVHLYYDGNTAEGEYDIVYDTSATVDRLDPGEHTIEAVVANADHSLTDARDEVTVTVGEGGGSGDDGGEDDEGDDPGGGSDGDATTSTTGADDGDEPDYGY